VQTDTQTDAAKAIPVRSTADTQVNDCQCNGKEKPINTPDANNEQKFTSYLAIGLAWGLPVEANCRWPILYRYQRQITD